jgi:hypothetical protein
MMMEGPQYCHAANQFCFFTGNVIAWMTVFKAVAPGLPKSNSKLQSIE